jgi:riboflavin biosynthesis pyrimidine reductase
LRSQGIASLMVEGGAQVITSFLRHRLVDFFVLTIAPILVGGLRAVEDLSNGETGLTTRAFPRIKVGDWIRLGDDLVLWGQPAWTE